MVAAAISVIVNPTSVAAISTEESIEKEDGQRETWGPEVDGLRCRLVAVPTNSNDESPDSTTTISNFVRGDDVTFAVELQNVSDEPATLLGVRYGDSYGKAEGKLATASFAPHLFEFEFTTQDGTPVPRATREYVDSALHLSGASVHEIEPGKSLIVLLRPAKIASPMDYNLAPGSYRAKVRYHGLSEKALAKIKKHWPDKPQTKAWSGEISSNEVAFTVAADPNAPKEVDLEWGKPNKGLRAAVEFKLRHADGTTTVMQDTVPFNTLLNVTVHLQNVSDQPIALVSETWRQEDRLTVIDDTGKETSIGGPWYSGVPVMVRWSLKPGEVAEIQSAAIGVVHDKGAAAELTHPIGKHFIAKPGRYLFRYSVRLGHIQMKDGEGNVILPTINDWQGQLVTGDTPLDIVARATADDEDESSL
jgi:hypothetical protein